MHGGVEIPPAIGSEVQNQVLHTFLLQFFEGLYELLGCIGGKFVQLDKAGFRCDHIGRVNAIHRYVIAGNTKKYRVGDSTAGHTQGLEIGYSAFGTAQIFLDIVLGNLDTGNIGVIHRYDSVTGQNPHLLRRTVGYRRDYVDGVLYKVVRNSYPGEVTLERFIQLAGLLGVCVRGMRVKFLKHADNGILHQLVLVHCVYIQLRYGLLGITQLVERRINLRHRHRHA